MDEDHAYHHPDRAIIGQEIGLGREAFVDRIASALVEIGVPGGTGARTARGVTLGVVGPWGSGKSTVLASVETTLKARGTIVVRFDPWLVSGRDDLVAAFLRELGATLDHLDGTTSKDVLEHAKSAVKRIAEYGEALLKRGAVLGANVLLPGAGEAVQQVVGDAASLAARATRDSLADPGRTLTSIRKDVNNALLQMGRPIVVLIDELDRIEDAEVRAVAQLVKAVADFPQVSYLLAYDRDRVVEALGGRERGSAYLEKIVQYEVALPIAFDEELSELAKAGLADLAARDDIAVPDDWAASPLVEELLRIAFSFDLLVTPRDLKRWVGQYAVLEPMIRDETYWADILALSLLESKKPDVVQVMRWYPDRFVTDKAEASGFRISTADPADPEADYLPKVLDSAIGHASDRRGTLALLGWLFPVWQPATELTWSPLDSEHPDRLRNSSPYFAALRRGLPPWNASQDTARRVLLDGWASLEPYFDQWPLETGHFGTVASRAAALWLSSKPNAYDNGRLWQSFVDTLSHVDQSSLCNYFLMNEILSGPKFGASNILRVAAQMNRVDIILGLQPVLEQGRRGDYWAAILAVRLAVEASTCLAKEAVSQEAGNALKTLASFAQDCYPTAFPSASSASNPFEDTDGTKSATQWAGALMCRAAAWGDWRQADLWDWQPIDPKDDPLASLSGPTMRRLVFLFYRGPGAFCDNRLACALAAVSLFPGVEGHKTLRSLGQHITHPDAIQQLSGRPVEPGSPLSRVCESAQTTIADISQPLWLDTLSELNKYEASNESALSSGTDANQWLVAVQKLLPNQWK
ncbi:MAG: P-loop NTPase fold protein [Pseudomonadota bacterium]